jgi:hypothetical protein
MKILSISFNNSIKMIGEEMITFSETFNKYWLFHIYPHGLIRMDHIPSYFDVDSSGKMVIDGVDYCENN